mmetsp:Transcript_123107/g.245072  ORF Transcript_123107/g.245072 Transcript_123107/m.245072 type:complete len:115 (-) Transcript_123107:280-624(-)
MFAQSGSGLCLRLSRKKRKVRPAKVKTTFKGTTTMQGLMSLCWLSQSARRVFPALQCGLLFPRCPLMSLWQARDVCEKLAQTLLLLKVPACINDAFALAAPTPPVVAWPQAEPW